MKRVIVKRAISGVINLEGGEVVTLKDEDILIRDDLDNTMKNFYRVQIYTKKLEALPCLKK